MGICTSIDASSVSTAKLILPDGTLEHYNHPIKANYVLQRLDKNAAFCICNADEMDFNDVVSALSDNDWLQLGELYFLLPISVLKRPMKAAEMAELAVRASSALMECCGETGWSSDENENVNVESSRRRGDGRRRKVEVVGRGRRRTYSSDLSAIAE